MNRLLKIVSVLLVIIIIALAFAGCSERGRINALISKLEKACHDTDIEAIFDCVDPRYSNIARGIYGFIGGIIDYDSVKSLLDSIIGIGSLITGDESRTDLDSSLEFLRTAKIRATKFEFNENKDKCEVTAEYSRTVNGKKSTDEIKLNCVLYDGEWYISLH